MIGLLKGLQATISHMLRPKVTVQYPEERRALPERSRGLIRLRLKENAADPRCISCTFCEQTCPGTAIKVIYEEDEPGSMLTLDAGAGPMLCYRNPGESALGLPEWPENRGAPPAPARDGCLAASFISAGELTPMVLAKAASRTGIWLSQAFGVANFYDQLGPGAPRKTGAPDYPGEFATVEGCPPVLLGGFGAADPVDIDAYASGGGFEGTTKTLTGMTPVQVVEEVSVSGLRGRSGGGFTTGAKWKAALEAPGASKYVICNASEGDIGSYKDRAILENAPYRVVEGMIMAGYAIGAGEGVIYLESGNTLALERIEAAIERTRERGLLDEEIPGIGFRFSIRVVAVPEAYIGGEETALIETLEGRRPMPRVRPPYPSSRGLYGSPTVVENVETLAAVPWIIARGAREYQQIGAGHAPGTKLFMLSGAVGRPGLYEAPMTYSLKKLVEEVGGGFSGEAKAALIGAPGGGFLSPGLFDIPLDYDSIAEAGGDLSSGAIRVIGGDECVPRIVRECLAYSVGQACGKCVPDRLGSRRLLDIIDRICTGEAGEGDLGLAAELAADIRAGSLCGLGQGAVRPLLTGLGFFRQEFEEHAGEGKCRAGKCTLG